MRRFIVLGLAAWIAALVGCVLGEAEEPGCVEDAECGEGYACRAGACFRELSGSPFVPADAGADAADDGDAGAGGGGGG